MRFDAALSKNKAEMEKSAELKSAADTLRRSKRDKIEVRLF